MHRPPSDLNAPPGAHLHLRLEPRDLLLQLPDEVGLVHPVALHRGADLLHHVREAQRADRLLQVRPRRAYGGDHTGAAVTAQAVRQQERESRVAEGEVLAIEALPGVSRPVGGRKWGDFDIFRMISIDLS